MTKQTYCLIDTNLVPPLLVDRGTYDEMQELLDEIASVDGYGGYQILTQEEMAIITKM